MTQSIGNVVVTGAASGIGRATCELMAEQGWQVLAVDRDADKLGWTDGKKRIAAAVADIAVEEANQSMIAEAEQRFGGVDAVILNAALSMNGSIDRFPLDDFDRLIAVNLRGTVLGIRAALPALRRRGGGSITITSSGHGLAGDAGFWAYAATKHGLIGVVKSVAREVGWEKIRINAICPGPVRATGISMEFENEAPEAFQTVSRSNPAQRWGEPGEIAAALAFVASPAASYINGVAFPVDGGAITGSGCLAPATSSLDS